MIGGNGMDYQALLTAISTVGFPIVCCGVCFWYIYKTGTQHKEEMGKMSEAINNNTLVMQKLIDKLGGE
jgi:hypothetical protein